MKLHSFMLLLARIRLFGLILLMPLVGRADDQLTGVWLLYEGWQITELTFRSDGRFQIETRNSDTPSEATSSEKGLYSVDGSQLILSSYDFLGEPQTRTYTFQRNIDFLSLTRTDFELPEVVYQLKPGSREVVMASEQVEKDVIGTWGRDITFWGRDEYTFRPGGYYFLKSTHLDSQFPPDLVRGRYTVEGNRLKLMPYSGVTEERELDFFGNTLTMIRNDGFSGDSRTFVEVAGSEEEVRAKSAAAEAFLAQQNWQVGEWEIRAQFQNIDLTIRPDGYYAAKDNSEFLAGVVRGRYVLEPRRIHFLPFNGQGIYSRSNGDFGKVDRTRDLDYYDGELQIIDPTALSQTVALARKKTGSQTAILEKTRLSQLERQREGWHIGVWEVNDPAGWMEFTFRPDNRYIAKAGASGIPSQVERGQYKITQGKITLAPYSGLGQARGFQIDLYDGNLFMVGDSQRMVIARKIPDSEASVIEKTLNPIALKGERGGILGRWSADMPGSSAELVFRDDGQFRLRRCSGTQVQDYGLYTVDLKSRTVVYDSRFAMVQTLSIDFYGDTMTLHGGLQAPATYTVNLGTADADIQASFAADIADAQVDAQWLARIPIGPRNPNAVQVPVGTIPADPFPTRVFENPSVFNGYQLYRRLIPGFVYFNVNGEIRSVAVTNTREWHFFPTGRVLIRFKNYSAGFIWPNTIETVSDGWGAYRIEPKPAQNDILHAFADNGLIIETDLGEVAEMTLEDGRRHLFWGKDFQLQSEWAAEQKVVPCELPAHSNASLINVPLSLTTTIPADPMGETSPIEISIARGPSGSFIVTGASDSARTIVVEFAANLTAPLQWQAVQTNSIPAGPFTFNLAQITGKSAYFRLRAE